MSILDRPSAERDQLTRRELWTRSCRDDLNIWAIEALRPHRQVPARHQRFLNRYLMAVDSGEIDRLMIFMPPGSAKSTYASVLFPAWFFRGPNMDIIGASHAADLATDFSKRVQTIITHNSDILGYGLESTNVERWRTTNGGQYRAAGVGGSITGRRADLAIIDDPVRGAADAESLVIREATWNWYQAELYTRLKGKGSGAVIVIQTRWHMDDLGGRLLERMKAGGDQWTIVNLPALANEGDMLGRAPGEALWPEWQDESKLARIRANAEEHVWGALYQQDPHPRGASFFDLDRLLVDGQPVDYPVKCDTVFATLDTAIKSGSQHNSTAIAFWSYDSLKTKERLLLLDWDIVQIEGAAQAAWLPTMLSHGEQLARTVGARRGFGGVFIEDKATGTVLIQQAENLRRQGKHYPVWAIDSKLTAMGKEERAIAIAPYWAAGAGKITQHAYDKTKVHKGRSANHYLVQVGNFRLGSKETDGLDLLDVNCYGFAMAFGASGGERKGI